MSVAWDQVICLPRVIRSIAFFADVADNCAVSYEFGSFAVITEILSCGSLAGGFSDVFFSVLDEPVLFAAAAEA